MPEPRTLTRTRTRHEPRYRVLLHDGDVHTMDFVADCLVRVFRFSRAEAWAVMSEAHCTGTALCTIEPRPAADRHRGALRGHGLTATVEPDGA